MRKICFVNYYQSKTTINQNKETTAQSYCKMSKENITESPGIEFVLINCTGGLEMNNFGRLNSSLYFICIGNKPAKKIYEVCTLAAEHPISPNTG